MTNQDADLLRAGAAELGVRLTAGQMERFDLYLRELNTWRRRMNLVSRGSDREIILKDFLDSLTVLKHLPPGASLADCGSGAGFPGVPIKIARPDLKVSLIDSAQKKVFFLKNLLRVLALSGIEALWAGKIKESRGQHPGGFDVVVTRAFGTLDEICRACGFLAAAGGVLLAMKGRRGSAELAENLSALEEGGWKPAFSETVILPFLGHERVLIGLTRAGVPRGTSAPP